MDIETILRESQAEQLSESLGFQTETGKREFSKQLRFFTADIESLRRRQETVRSFRAKLTETVEVGQQIETVFSEIAKLEPELKIFTTKSTVEKDSYEQLTFSSWIWSQVLNTIPFVLLLLSYFKLYVVPALALLTPILLLVMPYFILTYGYNLPLTISQYQDLMMGMIGIQTQTLSTPKGLVQAGLTLFSVGQSMIQPVQTAIHLQTIHKDLVQKGNSVERLANKLAILSHYIPLKNPLEEFVGRSDPHRSFGETWDLPFRLTLAVSLAGDAEVIYRLAKSSMNPVAFQTKECLSLVGARDPLLNNSIPFSVNLVSDKHKHTHAIVTGPNRGGKSSFLRATLLNIVFAQTFGLNFTDSTHLKPVDWIATGLRLEDRPGKSSMFEREVEFAVEILKKAKQFPKQTGLILFDELFHSTNPPDGTRTASLFLEQVWKQSNIISLISTHVFSLAKEAPDSVLRFCVPAYNEENGDLTFTYTLHKGICEVSSVDCILKEKGLLTADFEAPENHKVKER